MLTVKQVIDEGCVRLVSSGVDDARFEATQLLACACGKNASGLFPSDRVDTDVAESFFSMIELRCDGTPLQYIIGEWDFYKYTFFCGEGVLIPRPETEELTEICIDFVRNNNCVSVIDLCSGTGCIGISIALECPQTHVTLVDYYDGALGYLRKNVNRYNLRNVTVIKDSVLAPSVQYGSFGLIVSNPPYIPTEETKTLQKEVLSEPVTALDGGTDGLDFYRAIKLNFLPHLNPGGMLAFECAEDQPGKIAEMYNPLKTDCLNDIYGNPRFVTVQK